MHLNTASHCYIFNHNSKYKNRLIMLHTEYTYLQHLEAAQALENHEYAHISYDIYDWI